MKYELTLKEKVISYFDRHPDQGVWLSAVVEELQEDRDKIIEVVEELKGEGYIV